MKKTSLILAVLALHVQAVVAAELQHTFSSPSFNGVGYSSHVLTIKQLEDQAKDKNKAQADAIITKHHYSKKPLKTAFAHCL